MSNLVIVALPAEDDLVWKVSSEKVPHMTLLFLGDNADDVEKVNRIFQFVHHAVTFSDHGPFYLDVDHRSILGEDKADVIHFAKDWSFKWIERFRNQLLQNTDIRTAYESAEQFPEWRPHLTLGYPETPAKELDEDRAIHMVRFNRIAVWDKDYDGPWFRLKWPERELDEVAWSNILGVGEEKVAEVLEHYGVKGQKWGVRKLDTGGEIRINNKTGMAAPSKKSTVALVTSAVLMPPIIPALFLSSKFRSEIKATRAHNKGELAKKQDAKDLVKFEKEAKSAKGFVAIHNGAHKQINESIATINKKYSEDLTKNPARQKEYDAEITQSLQSAYRTSANSLTNRKATHHVDLEFVNDGLDFKIHVKEGPPTPMLDTREVKHAAADAPVTFGGKVKRTATGHVFNLVFDDFDSSPIKHTMTAVERGQEFILMHYGTKGMKWGVRNDRQGRNRWKTEGYGVKGDVAKSIVSVPANVRVARRVGSATASGAKKAGNTRVGRGLKRAAGDIYFETDMARQAATNQVSSQAARRHAKEDLPVLKQKYSGTKAETLKGRMKNPLDKNTIAYRRDARTMYRDRINEEVAKLPGNSSGTRKYQIEDGGRSNAQYHWELRASDVKRRVEHAGLGVDDMSPVFYVRPIFDEDGFIVDVVPFNPTPDDEALEQTVLTGEEFVTGMIHYGVKGMKWGVRKPPPAAVSPSAASVVPHGTKRKTKIVVKGGENHDAAPEAIKAAEAAAKLQKSGPKALSNKELQELQVRLNLERNVTSLVKEQTTVGRGRKFVKNLTGFNKDINDTVGTGYQTIRLARQAR